MRSSSKLTGLIAAVAAVSCFFEAASAEVTLSEGDKRQISRCISYMLVGPQTNGIAVKGEGFNCKPAKATMAGGILIVKGQLSHQLTWRPDDQVNYKFEFGLDGAPLASKVELVDGGVTKVLSSLAGFDIRDIPLEGLPVVGSTVEWVTDKLRIVINDNWEGYSTLILSSLQTQISLGLAKQNVPGVSTFFMDHPYGDLRSFKIDGNTQYPQVKTSKDFRLTYPNACKAMCRADSACKAWTFTRTDNRCYLKDASFSALSFHAEAVTGVR